MPRRVLARQRTGPAARLLRLHFLCDYPRQITPAEVKRIGTAAPKSAGKTLSKILGNILPQFVDLPLGVCNPITSLCVGVIHARKTVASVKLLKELLNGKDLEPSRFSNNEAAAGCGGLKFHL